MKTLTYSPTDNPSKNVHGNQQSIYDKNTQRKELDKGMLISNTLKGKLNSKKFDGHIMASNHDQGKTEDNNSEIRKAHFLVQDNT